MKRREKLLDLEALKKSLEFEKIGIQGVMEAKKENKKLGIPTVYMINDEILYELPDGTITDQSPFKKEPDSSKFNFLSN